MNLMYMLGASALIPYATANVLRIIIDVLVLLLSIAMVVVVVMQKPVTNNIGTIAGEETQTYAGKNKGKSKESILRKTTIALGIAIAVLAILYFVTYIEV